MKKRIVFWAVLLLGVAVITAAFIALRNITPEQLSAYHKSIPLPIFTLAVAFVDSFNPCNFFAFILLLGILVETSEAKSKAYMIGAIFIIVVYVFYYLVMAAWLNVFKLIGFVDPLRICVGVLAIIVGIINCKELFFFKKGPSLMIPQRQKEKLYAKMRELRQVIANGSLPLLIVTTVSLAVFTSFIELLCTSGFPVIYTSILATKYTTNSLIHYYYLGLYCLVYVLPLFFIIYAVCSSVRSKQLTQKQAKIIKFVSGIIVILMGILLLVRPSILI